MQICHLLVLLLFLSGCAIRGESDHKIFISAELSSNDIIQIQKLIGKETEENILSIVEDEDTHVIEVTTGVVRGPLDGGGKSFKLQCDDGKWKITGTSMWVS